MKITAKNTVRAGLALGIAAAVIAALFWALPAAVSRYRRGAAEAAELEGRAERAIALLLPELERDQKDLDLRLKLVMLYIGVENYSRAEYLIERGMREQGGQAELYRLLCHVYVKQDKLLDVVTLLDSLPNPRVKEQLDAERPLPPLLSPPPGSYGTLPSLTAVTGEGDACYITLDGKVPSVAKNRYTAPIRLPQGQLHVRALSVGDDGLVSAWTEGLYVVDDVSEPVVFSEPAIEAWTRELINRPEGEIVSGLLHGVTEFVIREPHGYQTLNDLRWFTGLQTLSLEGTGDTYADISALSGLKGLKTLTLRNMGVDSMGLEALRESYALEHLDLSGNQIVTLGNLSDLMSLTRLILSNNSITDLMPLSGLVGLTELEIAHNGIEETLPLSRLVRLQRLDMQGNRVRDLQGLSGMRELLSLNLAHNAVVSVEPLSDLSALIGLSLSHNKELYRMELIPYGDDDEDENGNNEGDENPDGVGNEEPREDEYYNSLTPLGRLTGLQTLLLDACGIEDIAPLAPLTALRRLSLNDNRLTRLDDVREMTAMAELSVNRNQIASLRPLQGMTKLETLHVEYNGMPSLVAIRELPSLKAVYAFGNPITDKPAFTAPNVHVYYG